jgi:hypothetical protein
MFTGRKTKRNAYSQNVAWKWIEDPRKSTKKPQIAPMNIFTCLGSKSKIKMIESYFLIQILAY